MAGNFFAQKRKICESVLAKIEKFRRFRKQIRHVLKNCSSICSSVILVSWLSLTSSRISGIDIGVGECRDMTLSRHTALLLREHTIAKGYAVQIIIPNIFRNNLIFAPDFFGNKTRKRRLDFLISQVLVYFFFY